MFKNVFQRTWILLSVVCLSLGVLFLFFGGTWEGVKFGLEILGSVYIIQLSYKAITEWYECLWQSRNFYLQTGFSFSAFHHCGYLFFWNIRTNMDITISTWIYIKFVCLWNDISFFGCCSCIINKIFLGLNFATLNFPCSQL